MKLQHKIFIDCTLGQLMATLLNLAARVLGKVLRIDHDLSRVPDVIAVCKLVGLGSIIQSGPLVRSLRTRYPQAHIIYVTHGSNAAFVSKHFPVNQVIPINDHSVPALFLSVLTALASFWRKRPAMYIDLEIYSNFSSVLTTLSLSTNRLGFYKSDKHYRIGMYTHMMFFNVQAPVSEVYLQFSRLLGSEHLSTELIEPVIKTDHESMSRDRLEKSHGVPKDLPYFVFNPNASELRIERRWPADSFASLAKELLIKYPEHKICFTGNARETSYVNSLIDKLQGEHRVVNTAGKLDLEELIILLKHADLLVTNDTGPMHLAASLKVKSVTLFGPCSPDHYGASDYCYPVYKKVYCSPCVHEFILPPCKGNNTCMQMITVSDVTRAIEDALSGHKRSSEQKDYIFSESLKPFGVIHCR